MMPATRTRDYDAIVHELTLTGDRSMRMHALVDILWRALAPTGVSWIGFYLRPAEGDHLVLGPRRDKPACSPIGMNGACGRSWTAKKSLVVTDVSHLGSGYIACDPKDRSEVVVPLIETTGHCWGVLDADARSASIESF